MTVFRIKEKENSLITEDAHELICYATISEINSWNDIVNLYSEIKQKHFPKKVLLLLEDIGQCEYTSMHASMGEGFILIPQNSLKMTVQQVGKILDL
ncbi:hypothetical protein OCUAc20_02750 [Acinetobacter baumannii]|nr:hypothetical protein OCUAc20_02750 [Acinetobacter baumannii]